MKTLMKLFTALAMFLLLMAILPAKTVLAAAPVISITDMPPYNVRRPIQGQVYMEDGSEFDPSAYRISLYLQVEPGQQYWVKPTSATPYVELMPDGSFSGTFITGGNDIIAKVLHVMLIPADYMPAGGGFYDTRNAALDYVKITRTEDGQTEVDPARTAPALPGIQPAINALLPVRDDRLAVDIGFYTDGSQPGSRLSEVLIRRQLAAVSHFSDTVRFYGSAGELDKAYRIAHDMGFSVVGTAWLSGNEAADKEEMDALIRHCNSGFVQVACVGNETLLRNDLTAKELVDDINYVRERLNDKSIPVTTSDSVDILLGNPYVRNACSLIMPNIYPYWGGTDISRAAAEFIESAENLAAVRGGTQILVSETGWPTAGSPKGQATPGEAEAAAYFDAVRTWSLATGTQVLWFEAADEPWKVKDEGISGRHWGLLSTDFELKDGYAGTMFFRDHPYGGPGAIDISDADLGALTAKVYTGKAITQSPVVKLGSITLAEGTDYTVSYAENENPGTAAVTVTGKGYYTGTVTGNFRILFKDVTDESRWYFAPVYWALDNKAASGYNGGTFQPTRQLTRAQAVAFLYNMAGKPDISGLETKEFSDVAESAWYYDAVKWASAVGITSGMGPGTFQPDYVCNRAMIVTFLCSYAKLTGTYRAPETEAHFADVPQGAWYKESVDWAAENKVTSGMGAGTFQPKTACSRAMMAAFLRTAAGLPKA